MSPQLLHYLYNAGLLRHIEPELLQLESADRLAAHIAEFSLAGLYAMRDRHREMAVIGDGWGPQFELGRAVRSFCPPPNG